MAACRSRPRNALVTWLACGIVIAFMAVQMTEMASALDLKGKKVPGPQYKKLLPPGLTKKLPPTGGKKPQLPITKPIKPLPPKPKKPEAPKKKPELPKKKPEAPKKKPELPKKKPEVPNKKKPELYPKKKPELPKKKPEVPLKKPLVPKPGSPPPKTSLASTELSKLPGLPPLPTLPFDPLAPFLGGPWLNDAHATYYGDETGAETMGGACGYGDLFTQGYGLQTTALSEVMFNNGYGCGECYEIKCVDSKWCNWDKSITVTATNLCPADWSKPSDNGGWCNPPRNHFDLSKVAFLQIAQEIAGIVPVSYRRVPCVKLEGIKYTIFGNTWWHLVHITNVGGAGDIDTVSVKGTQTDWIPMTRNWGATYQVFQSLVGQALSFQITSKSGQTLTSWNVAPSGWQFGVTYVGNQFP